MGGLAPRAQSPSDLACLHLVLQLSLAEPSRRKPVAPVGGVLGWGWARPGGDWGASGSPSRSPSSLPRCLLGDLGGFLRLQRVLESWPPLAPHTQAETGSQAQPDAVPPELNWGAAGLCGSSGQRGRPHVPYRAGDRAGAGECSPESRGVRGPQVSPWDGPISGPVPTCSWVRAGQGTRWGDNSGFSRLTPPILHPTGSWVQALPYVGLWAVPP